MKCRKVEKWISDDLDGTLSLRRQKKLRAHAAVCASCRAYGGRLKKIQAEAKRLPGPALPPAYWERSLSRLESSLAGVGGQTVIKLRPGRTPAFFPALRWAWAGAASLLAVGLGLYLMFFQSRGPLVTTPLSFGDQINSLYERIGENAELETEFNSLLHASIVEEAGESDGDVKPLLYGSSRFLDSLSDEEILILDAEISRALKI